MVLKKMLTVSQKQKCVKDSHCADGTRIKGQCICTAPGSGQDCCKGGRFQQV